MEYREITVAHKRNLGAGCTPFCIERCGPDVDDSLHIHDFHQLTIITRGTGVLVVNGAGYPVRAGDGYVIGSFSAHFLKETRGLEFVNILFYLRDLEPHCPGLLQNEGFRTLFYLQPVLEGRARPSNIFSLDYAEIETVNRLLGQLLEEQRQALPGRELMIQSIFLILITSLCRAYRNTAEPHAVFHSDQLCQAVQYMENNCAEPITLSDLERLCGLTGRQLRHQFSQVYDCTPLQYLWNLRIRKACYYLASTDLPISEIASMTGFEDNNYFSRKFRQALGTTPREYRSQSRAGAAPPGRD